LETYDNYRFVNPGSSMNDYVEEMNLEIHFDDFLNIMRQAALEESQDPDFIH
jgi:hypothetical protein